MCVVDRLCYSSMGDPAVPSNAANAVIPVAAVMALLVAPLSLYAVNTEANKRMVFLAGIVTVG